jgi:hypothetical protein
MNANSVDISSQSAIFVTTPALGSAMFDAGTDGQNTHP